MNTTTIGLFSLALFSFILLGCERETEPYQSSAYSDYIPLQVGKSITYRLDSTVFTELGRKTEVRSFQEKQVVDAQLTDNMGRTSYRILRFLRDTAGTAPWRPAGSYQITPTPNNLEVIENNLRMVKLIQPVVPFQTWKGNRYLPDEPYSSLYDFDNDDYMADWDYTYEELDGSAVFNGETVNNILTLEQVEESINVPVTDSRLYGFINYSVDRFAKGIGLVAQELIMWEYQPNPSVPGDGTKTGFGVKRTMIDHN